MNIKYNSHYTAHYYYSWKEDTTVQGCLAVRDIPPVYRLNNFAGTFDAHLKTRPNIKSIKPSLSRKNDNKKNKLTKTINENQFLTQMWRWPRNDETNYWRQKETHTQRIEA